MNEFYEELQEITDSGGRAALATIVRTRGSTPREVGARMVVRPDGGIIGTVGGGCGEAEVWAEAMTVLAEGTPRLLEVDLLTDSDGEGGRACGGIMSVFIEAVGAPVEPGHAPLPQCMHSVDGTE